ncbi:MAG TPA: prephenate dehydrogenase/arogenate dehydrogenase family protein, partial [Solirubrobacterales bacterium]
MRITILGVGLIGGSIGLAARRRLDAQVAGFDPDSATLERALELDALDEAAGSIAEACEGAELIFCAAPVSVLPELAREALAASGEECVVSNVGSTKREIVAALGQ